MLDIVFLFLVLVRAVDVIDALCHGAGVDMARCVTSFLVASSATALLNVTLGLAFLSEQFVSRHRERS